MYHFNCITIFVYFGGQFAPPGAHFAGAQLPQQGPNLTGPDKSGPNLAHIGPNFAAKNYKGPNFPGPKLLRRTAERHAMEDKQWLFVNFHMLTKVDKKDLEK